MKIVATLIEAHIVRNGEKGLEFLIMKRGEKEIYPNIWQMVTGSIEKNEKGYEAAVREIEEETSLRPIKIWVVPKINSFYSAVNDEICMVPVFAVLADKDANVKISDEHSEFMWGNKETVKELLAWPGQRESVDIIYEYFRNKKNELKFVEIEL